MKAKLFTIIAALAIFSSLAFGQSDFSSGFGRLDAYQYGQWSTQVWSGSTSTGAFTLTMVKGFATLPSGGKFFPFTTHTPISIGSAGAGNSEIVTPSAVSCSSQQSFTCTVTATFTYAHGKGDIVTSGTYGLQEAIDQLYSMGGGLVSVGPGWANAGGTNTILAAAVPYPAVAIEDMRAGLQYWNATPNTLAFMAVPTTLTAVTMLPSATPVGAYGTGTYYGCISYVDIMGNEGPCSLTFNEAGLATGSFIFSAPAASTGAVGYTIYISLTSGSYAFAYKVPLTSTVCTLTKVESITAACAVTNTTYGQTGATATVTAITVNTARLAPQIGVVSSTTDYVPNSNAHTVYAYAPGARVGEAGVVGSSLPFTITTAAATTVPNVLGTLELPAGFMNYIGKTLRVCGHATATGTSTATIIGISLWWDADGSNATGVPAVIGGPRTTITLASAADHYSFCQDLKTTVSGAGVTAGSLLPGAGWLSISDTVDGTHPMTSPNATVGAVGSLNLAGEARIEVVYLHTTGTDGTGIILQDLTAEVIN